MRVTTAEGSALVDLEGYGDLLRVRALPDYRFVGPAAVRVAARDLERLGVAVDEPAVDLELAGHLFDYQAWVVARAFERERFAVFMLTGLGKTAVQLEWARLVAAATGGRVLIVAPLNVCHQTIGEADHFYGAAFQVLDATTRPALDEWLAGGSGVAITNDEKLDGTTEALDVAGVVLDESSMLRSIGGPRKWAVLKAFAGVRFKLACSATPAPNDRSEYAQHAVFLGVVRKTMEYLSAYFRNDGDGNWTFKTHAYDAWVANLASWAVFMHDPARWGFEPLPDMPELRTRYPRVELTDHQVARARTHEPGHQPSLFGVTPGGITSRTKLQQIANGYELADGAVETFESHKPGAVVDLVTATHPDEQVIVWVHHDHEGDHLERELAARAVEVVHLSGRDRLRRRRDVIEAFAGGRGPRVLILKPAMFAVGLNLQACTVQVFSSVHDSFERFFQCVRRSWRFGQTRPVTVYVPLTALDEAINTNLLDKQARFETDAGAIEDAVVARLRPADTSEARVVDPTPKTELARTETDDWTMVWGDAVAQLDTMAADSVDLSVFSPPFPALFAYSRELGDVANVRGTAADTSEHRLVWAWLARSLARVMRPGRMVAIHCKEIVQPANIHGHRWCYDYPSELRAGMEDAGFHYHRRITIEKNPQNEATRNKESSLLHVTVRRNALNSFPQAGEYLLVFQAPGTPEVPVPCSDLSFEDWCRWANSIWPDWATPTWHGIRETDVLNTAVARETPDERHVCPLQLGLIERVVRLWSNPGELVLSPFAGIGSELYVARQWGRRGYGVELKESYYRTAITNLQRLDQQLAQDLRLVDLDDISPSRPPAPQHHRADEQRPERNTAPQAKAASR